MIKKWQALHIDLQLHEENYVCVNCRKALCKRAPPADADEPARPERQSPTPVKSDDDTCDETGGSGDQTASDEDATAQDHDMDVSANALGETPIKRKRLRNSKKYRRAKFMKIAGAMENKLKNVDAEFGRQSCDGTCEKGKESDEMINELRQKFAESESISDKMRVLTATPRSWSILKVMTEFGATNHQARLAKQLQKKSGCFSEVNLKPGKVLEPETEDKVVNFYRSDQVSRVMPGKNFVSVQKKRNGKREHVQRRLILCNLKEAYRCFKGTNPALKKPSNIPEIYAKMFGRFH